MSKLKQGMNNPVVGLLLMSTAFASPAVADSTIFKSPNGIQEVCEIPARMPGAVYRENDLRQEQAFCRIDFYDGKTALCPKVFSTSPGTLVYDIGHAEFSGKAAEFEAQQCKTSSPVKRGASGKPVSYKMTMNQPGTSGTFSTASLLYYHFSRYFNADVFVPVSVYRSMDKDIHRQRVSSPGLKLSAGKHSSRMNHTGWKVLHDAEKSPSQYKPTSELFTPDRKQVYGVMLSPHGDRYGVEINGTRESGWGNGQNYDFQKTAPFSALRSDKPLEQAIEAGIEAASENRLLQKSLQAGVSSEQMVYWMKELTEITLLDYIFSQQDRIGNIDYLKYWYWSENGQIKSRPAHGSQLPDDLKGKHAVLLKRTQLNDNDAGGRLAYANFTKKTRMLEGIRHYSADTYRRLLQLDNDLQSQNELYQYIASTFQMSGRLSDRQMQQIVKNTRLATDILQKSCEAGKLRFDLDPETYFITGKSETQTLDCRNP